MAIEETKSPDQLKVEELKLSQPLPSITLTPPQLIGVNYGWTHNKFVLSMDKGMGKTVVYQLITLNGEPDHVVIVCPTNAMAAQRREILRHFPEYAESFIFVRGQAHQRYKQWRNPSKRIFITTMATLQTDLGGRLRSRSGTAKSDVVAPEWVKKPDALVPDEFQKFCRRPKSNSFKLLKTIDPHRLIMSSGSPVSTGPHELWPALHLIDRKFWSSYWRYVEQFCVTHDGLYGKEIIGPKNVEAWRAAVAPYVFHRRKDPRDYPPKNRHILDFELPPWQRKLHDELRNALWAFTDEGDIITARNKLDALYRARLGLICPKAIDPSFGIGAGIEGIAEDASDLSHVVVSTPFRAPIPHLKHYIESHLKRKCFVLSGGLGIDPDTQDRIITDFERDGGWLIQTIKYATSYEFIGGPEHNYFLGYEYDPEDNKQAEDRFQRISSTRPSFHWYVRFMDTYDEELIERLVIKGQNVTRLMDTGRSWAEWLQ